MPQKINVQEPLISSIGARLVTRRASESTDIEGIYVEIIRYDGQRYHLVEPSGNGIPNRFALPGLLGCTATINLGFLLLKELQATTTTQLGVLILFDQERLNELVETDIEVDDDYIIGYSLT
jgi:hypothetical protein